MDIRLAKLNVKATCGSTFYLTGLRPVYAYENGNRAAEPHAFVYAVVLPERKFAELDVLIEGSAQMDPPENTQEVTFVGLELVVKWSKDRGNYIAGVAAGIAPVSTSKT